MNYTELHTLITEKYQLLQSVNNKLISLLVQKNKVDLELNTLQLQRQSLIDEVKELEKDGIVKLSDFIKVSEIKNTPKKLKDKTEFSMQPQIEHGDEK